MSKSSLEVVEILDPVSKEEIENFLITAPINVLRGTLYRILSVQTPTQAKEKLYHLEIIERDDSINSSFFLSFNLSRKDHILILLLRYLKQEKIDHHVLFSILKETIGNRKELMYSKRISFFPSLSSFFIK